MRHLHALNWDVLDVALLVELSKDCTVAEAGDRLGLSPSAVSHRLRRLQKRLGFSLTVHVGRNLSLTDQARAALPFLREVIENLQYADRTISQSHAPAHRVGIARIFTGWAEPLLPATTSNGQPIPWHLMTGTSDEVIEWVRQGTVDAGLVRTHHGYWDIDLHVLNTDALVAVATPTVGRNLPPSPAQWPWIGFHAKLGHARTVNQLFVQWGWPTSVRYQVDALTSALSLVRSGQGVSVLPHSLVTQDIIQARLQVMSIPHVQWPVRTVGLVTQKNNPLTWIDEWGVRIKRHLS